MLFWEANILIYLNVELTYTFENAILWGRYIVGNKTNSVKKGIRDSAASLWYAGEQKNPPVDNGRQQNYLAKFSAFCAEPNVFRQPYLNQYRPNPIANLVAILRNYLLIISE